jgi:hypothetical protein
MFLLLGQAAPDVGHNLIMSDHSRSWGAGLPTSFAAGVGVAESWSITLELR